MYLEFKWFSGSRNHEANLFRGYKNTLVYID